MDIKADLASNQEMKDWRQEVAARQTASVKLLKKTAHYPDGHTQAVDLIRDSVKGWCAVLEASTRVLKATYHAWEPRDISTT